MKVDADGQLHVFIIQQHYDFFGKQRKARFLGLLQVSGISRFSENTPLMARRSAAQDCAKVAYDLGLRKVKAYVKGPGNGRESAIRTVEIRE